MIFCDKNVTISGSLSLPKEFFSFSQMSDFVPAFLTEICDKGNCLNLSHDIQEICLQLVSPQKIFSFYTALHQSSFVYFH